MFIILIFAIIKAVFLEEIMSSAVSIVIILIIILIIAAIAAAVITNKHFNQQIAQLDQDSEQLNDLAAKEDIKRLEKMELAGKSLETFETCRDSYQEVETKQIGVLQHLLEEAAEVNAKYALIKAYKLIKQAQTVASEAQKVVDESKQTFSQLLESNRDNKIKYAALSKDYQQQRKYILANSFDYGVALDQLENNLMQTEKDFESVKNLSAQGDHVEAKRVLSKIQTSLTKLKNQLPKIKNYDQDLKETFPEQLDEITKTYKQMVHDKFKIDEVDVLETVKNLRDRIESSQDRLSKLELKEVEKDNQEINQEIDELYAILTKEFKAKPFIDKNQDKIVKILGHISNNSAKLVSKLQHIDESYELTHGELAEAKELASRVNHLNVDFGTDSQKLADGEGVYSEIEGKWLAMLQELDEIQQREQKISNDVDGLFDAEEIANDSINRFKQSVSLIYRRLERRQLPGKPESFIQMYTLVVNEISKTSEELNQVRINLEKISNELIQIQEDIDRLQKEADEILSSADLVELTMQYSNKYIKHQDVQRARKEAYDLYQNKYEYKEALDTIATALEKIEPGSYQRIEKEYYSEKDDDEEDK